MLEPNDSGINVDNAEDACKSDYFSDDGELKTDTPSTENGSSGKRKPIDIGLEEAKKIKVSTDEIPTAENTTKLQTGIPPNDFKRAGSVTSDNSDEFVDASDVLEPVPTVEKKPAATDDVDACAVKPAARSDTSKSMFESVSPKVKDKKFNSRLPTFADDPLDHFNSSAIRRGFFKEVEPPKPVDSNFDLNSSDKNDLKNENKTIRKVKLNRSKFFSNDKPKFSDDSSSDSNSKFNNSTSPVKTELASSNENKVFQRVKIENKITQPSLEEKNSVANEPPAATPSVVEHPKADIESSSNTEPEKVRVSVESENHSIDGKNIPTELPSSSNIEEKIQDNVPQDQSDQQIEQESLDISEPIDSTLDKTETEELTLELDDLMEESIIEPVSKINDVIDEEMNELPITDDEPHPDEQIETQYESVVPEPESTSMETEYESVMPEPESTSMETEYESVMPEPESSSIEPEYESVVAEPESTSIEPEVESVADEPKSTSIEPEVESVADEPESTSIEPEVESEPKSTSIEPEVESVAHEPESTSVEPEPQLVKSNEPEPLPIEPSSSPQPVQSNEPSSPHQPTEPKIHESMENETLKQANDQDVDLEDEIQPFKVVSSQSEFKEPEKVLVSDSDPHQEPISDLDLVSESKESESTLYNEFVDTKDTQSEPEPVQKPAVSETIPEPESIETEPQSQSTDLDITNESEDIADDKTETYVSNEESEGEIEEEEEEEIHEEELYLEDRVLVPSVTKPKDPSPPKPTPSLPAEKETKDVVEINDEEVENVIQSSSQSTIDPEPVKQSLEPTPRSENIENVSVEHPVQHSTSVKYIEDIPVEQEGGLPSEGIEDIPKEQTVQNTPSLEDIADIPVEQTVQRSPSIENIADIPVEPTSQRPPSLEDTADIPVQKSVQRTPSLEDIENIPMDIDVEPEPVVTKPIPKGLSKLEQALIGKTGIKKLEIQVPLEECPIPYEIVNERASSSSADTEETKEKIKLHLSLQGDKVSIKKSPNTSVSSTGEPKTKRQYKRRNKEANNLKPDKTYKLRTRAKKDAAAQENDQTNPTATAGVDKVIDLDAVSSRTDESIYSAEPILIDSDDSTKSGSTKVQPLKLKITKNTNVTIECPPTYPDPNKNHDFSGDARKKDSIPNLMEQAATAWSGPDLQRVERLLKESNITITPVLPKESIIPQSILKPMLSHAREKPSTAPKFSTPSVSSSVSSFQSSTSCITPIPRDKYEDSSSGYTSPQSLEHQNGEPGDHRRFRDGYETSPSSTDKQIDIKSEIRRMLASSDKRKLEPRDSTDMESNSSDSKPKPKAVPDLVPINLPTPEVLQSLATSLGANTTAEGDPLSDKSKPEIDPAFLPLLQTFPKKRGRPTKAMVAAREALKQSQEVALENLKQLASQKASEGQPIPMPILDITDPEDLFKPKRGRKSRSERMDKSSDAEQSASETTIDPEKEAEEIKRLEEERIKKEEEKERRNEIRRQKARERNDLVKAKRLRQKLKAEERQKRVQEKRRQLQEEKKKLEEEIKNLPTSMPGFDDETRMSAENSQALTMSFSTGIGDEDSSNTTNELSQRVKKSRMEVTDIDSRDLTVDQIAEYQWPIQGGDLYMIQEQVSNYLGVKSFKRKYPDIKRRPVDSEEKAYLVDSGLVSETLCDLGLTAVSSAEVLDIMCADFPDKYEELRKYMREKQMKELSFKQKAWANGLGYKLLMADGTKQDLKKRAMESASTWNSALNKSRSDDRRCAIDLQTFIVHYPKTRTRKMTIPTPKMGSYPVSILPGQFCDFYKNYTSTELRYMPINTVMYGPLKPHATAPGDGSQTDSDDSSSSDESSTTSEGTQATEDTIEDTDKDMSVDESSLLDKSHDLALLKEQMTMELSENTRELIMDETAKILCKICLGNITRNKENIPEVLIYCSQCNSTSHPSCLDLSLDMVPHIKKYSWQCPDCKICARCKENADEDKMLFCDTCDRGYHIYCVGLKKVPSGRWQCQECTTVENNSCVNNSTPVREVFKEPGLIDLQDG